MRQTMPASLFRGCVSCRTGGFVRMHRHGGKHDRHTLGRIPYLGISAAARRSLDGHSLPCTQRVRHSPDRSVWQDAHGTRRFCAAQGRGARTGGCGGGTPLRAAGRTLCRLLRRRGSRSRRRTGALPVAARRHDRPPSTSCFRASFLHTFCAKRACSSLSCGRNGASARLVAGALQRA